MEPIHLIPYGEFGTVFPKYCNRKPMMGYWNWGNSSFLLFNPIKNHSTAFWTYCRWFSAFRLDSILNSVKDLKRKRFLPFFFFNLLSFKGYHLVCYDKLHINWALTCLSSRRTCLVSSILFLLTCLMATRFPWEEAEQWLQCEGQHWCRVHFKHSCLQHGDINTGALCSRCK